VTKVFLDEMNRIYWRMIWDGKERGIINHNAALLPRDKGGVGGIDIYTINKASKLALVSRALRFPKLPWVLMLNEMIRLQFSRTKNLHMSKLEFPLLQATSKNRIAEVEDGIKEIVITWWKELGFNAVAGSSRIRKPKDMTELPSMYIWYNPLITNSPHNPMGARLWSSPIWKEVAKGKYGKVDQLKDILDGDTPVILSKNPIEQRKLESAFVKLLSTIPWHDSVRTTEATDEGSRQFNDTGLVAETRYGPPEDEKWIRTDAMTYKSWYDLLMSRLVAKVPLTLSTDGVMRVVNRNRVKPLKVDFIWNKCRSQDRSGKCNDFLWRLLHDRIQTGYRLYWLNREQQICPLCGIYQTIIHIFIKCPKVRRTWSTFGALLQVLGNNSYEIVDTVDELVGWMAVPPGTSTVEKTRWNKLYSLAIWVIWKSYLAHQFEGEWEDGNTIEAAFINEVLNLVRKEKTLALNKYAENKGKYNPVMFKKIWGISPEKVGLKGIPQFIQEAMEAA
jgi:hypothetical protein